MAPQSFILQDPTKSLVIGITITNSGSAVPDGTVTFTSTNDSSVLGTAAVVNPNGAETSVTACAFVNQNLSDSAGSVWVHKNIAATYNIGGVTLSGINVSSFYDSWGAQAGHWGVFPDLDGHSIWAISHGYDVGAIQKYDLSTKTLTKSFSWPFNGSGGTAPMWTFEDGSPAFFQDSAGFVYGLSFVNSGTGANSLSRLHKMDPATFAEIAALGYDDQYPAGSNPALNMIWSSGNYTDWCLFQSGGQDFVSYNGGNNAGTHGGAVVINLTTMVLVGVYSFSLTSFFNRSTFIDKNGDLWWVCNKNADTNTYLYKWHPADGVTTAQAGSLDPTLANMTLVYTVPTSETSSNSVHSEFSRYVPSIHAVILGNSIAADNGNAADLALISLVDGSQVAFGDGTANPQLSWGGTFDIPFSCFRDNKVYGLSGNTSFAIHADITTATTPPQRGGLVNLINPETLAILNTYNVTQIAAATIITGNGYTDQGNWSSGTDYAVFDIVTSVTNGGRFISIAPSGPSTAVKDPSAGGGSPTNSTWWAGIPNQLRTDAQRGTAYTPLANLVYNQSLATIVSTSEFVGSTLILTTVGAPPPPATVTTVAGTPNPSVFSGSPVVFTISVSPTNATGTITLLDGATQLASSLPLVAGVAHFTALNLNTGTHTITANFVPSGSFAASSGTLQQVVSPLRGLWTNAGFSNRLALYCTPLTGPFTSPALGLLDPRRDMQFYADGELLNIVSFSFDQPNNRYLMFADQNFNLQGTVQGIYSLPNPPFIAIPSPLPIQFGNISFPISGGMGTGDFTFSDVVQAGNAIVVTVATIPDPPYTFAISDNNGNAYTLVNTRTDGTRRMKTYAALDAAAGATTVTIHTTGSATSGEGFMLVQEFSAVVAASAIDAFADTAGTSATPTTPNVTTTVPGVLYGSVFSQHAVLSTGGGTDIQNITDASGIGPLQGSAVGGGTGTALTTAPFAPSSYPVWAFSADVLLNAVAGHIATPGAGWSVISDFTPGDYGDLLQKVFLGPGTIAGDNTLALSNTWGMCLAVFALTGSIAPTVIQHSQPVSGVLSSGASSQFLGNITAGSTIIVFLPFGNQSGRFLSFSDTLGNVYTPIVRDQGVGPFTSLTCAVGVAQNVVGGPCFVSFTSTGNASFLQAIEVQGGTPATSFFSTSYEQSLPGTHDLAWTQSPPISSPFIANILALKGNAALQIVGSFALIGQYGT
jgi:hypothetical protein